MLAWHNFHSANNKFPGDICDAEGKPLLSWRVAILPYLDQQNLYNEFHLDEPWDSAHNKPLIDRMPGTYRSPKAAAKETTTFYQAFVGEGAIFDSPTKAPGIAEITDGTSNTIAVAEAGKSVTWSKPDDIPFDRAKDVPKLGGLGWAGGFNAGFADGSVRFLKFSVNMDVLKALITKQGGEVISADSY
jgi:prepilin-type processing-associated H-X9-DG protein